MHVPPEVVSAICRDWGKAFDWFERLTLDSQIELVALYSLERGGNRSG